MEPDRRTPLAIGVVLLAAAARTLAATPRFVCDTGKYRIVVDGDDDPPRYRAWTKPRGRNEKPNMVMEKGRSIVEGTGPCRYERWRFERGNTAYEVGALGCTDGSEPKGTKGRLDIEIRGKLVQTRWCR